MQAAETKKKMEALSAIGKQAPRLGEGVRIVRQHNKRPTTRAGRAELKGKKRAFWGAMVMLPETIEARPERPPEMEYYDEVGVAGTQWSDMTADPLNPPDISLRGAPAQRPMGSGAPRRIDNSNPGSADQAAMALAMLSGQSFPEPVRAPPPRVPYSRPVSTHALEQRPMGQPPVAQRPMGQRPPGVPVMGQRPQGVPLMQRGASGPPMPPRPPGPPMPPHGPGMVPQQQEGGMVPQHGGGMVPRSHGPPHGSRPHGAPLAPQRSPGGPMIRPPGKARVVIVSPKTHWQGIPIEEIS